MKITDRIKSYFRKQPVQLQAPDRSPGEPKVSLFDPLKTAWAFPGKSSWQQTDFRGADGVPLILLDRIARTPVVASIIQTRINQMIQICTPQRNRFSPGLVVRPRMGVKVTRASEKKSDEIMKVVCNGGDRYLPGGIRSSMSALLRDSLPFDQAAFETLKRRNGEPYGWLPVDARTIRRAYPGEEAIERGIWEPGEYGFVQILNERVSAEFRDNELMFCVRRPRTALYALGYGYPELEELLDTMTSLLNVDTYRATQFDRGIQAAWLIVLLSKMSGTQFQAFSDRINALANGVIGAETTPMVQLDPEKKEDLKAVPLHRTSQEMELHKERMAIIQEVCALFSMDPAELGWVIGNEGGSSGLSRVPIQERIRASKEKGLEPLCVQASSWLTDGVVRQIDEDFELVILGLNEEDEQVRIESDQKKAAFLMTFNELRESYDLEPIDDGDVIGNSFYLQERSARQMREQQGGGPGGDPGSEDWWQGDEPQDDPAEDVEKGTRDPFQVAADRLEAAAKVVAQKVLS